MRAIIGIGLSLLDEGCEGLVQLSHADFRFAGIRGFEGLLEGRAKGLLQVFGIGSAVDPRVVPLLGTKNQYNAL